MFYGMVTFGQSHDKDNAKFIAQINHLPKLVIIVFLNIFFNFIILHFKLIGSETNYIR